MKDETLIDHHHNIVYKICCPNTVCKSKYIGGTGRHITEHSNASGKPNAAQHTFNSGNQPVSMDNVKILSKKEQ